MSYGPRAHAADQRDRAATARPVSSAISRTSAAASSSPGSTRPPGTDHSPRPGSLARCTSSSRPSPVVGQAAHAADQSSLPSCHRSETVPARVPDTAEDVRCGTNHESLARPARTAGTVGRGEREEDRRLPRDRAADLLHHHPTRRPPPTRCRASAPRCATPPTRSPPSSPSSCSPMLAPREIDEYLLPTERRVIRVRQHWAVDAPRTSPQTALFLLLVVVGRALPARTASLVDNVTFYLALVAVLRFTVLDAPVVDRADRDHRQAGDARRRASSSTTWA